MQVRVGRSQTPRVRARLQVGRVHAPCVCIDVVLQGVRVGRFQFRQLTPVEYQPRQFVFGGEVFEDLRTCRIGARLTFFPTRKAKVIKEHFAQLFGRADVELHPRCGLNLVL